MTKVGLTKLLSIFSDLRNKKLSDQMFNILISSLWRDHILLRHEKAITYKDNVETGYQRNNFGDTVIYGLAEGQNNMIEGERSAAFGQGNNTKSFLEIILGANALIPEGQNPTEWIPTDLLLTLGNGPDPENRSNVFEVYKYGFFKLLHTLKLGEWTPPVVGAVPENGTIQYTEVGKYQYWDTDHWVTFGSGSGNSAYVYIAYASDASGTGFTTTFDSALNYIAIKTTTSPIASPAVGDFTGLWKNYKGATGAAGANGTNGTNGIDGVPVEMSVQSGWVAWRYVGGSTWTNLYEVPIANQHDVHIKFDVVEEYTYICPYAMKLTAINYQTGMTPTISAVVNDEFAQYDTITITPLITGLVTLTFEWL